MKRLYHVGHLFGALATRSAVTTTTRAVRPAEHAVSRPLMCRWTAIVTVVAGLIASGAQAVVALDAQPVAARPQLLTDLMTGAALPCPPEAAPGQTVDCAIESPGEVVA